MSTSDDDSITGRVRRYARVGGAVGGLAARLAGERYLGMEIDRDRHAHQLRNALGGLKGPLMKVAQIMSTVPDMLPAEYVAELAHLQSRSEEHTSELQSLMRISYAVFCLQKKNT